MRFFAQPRETRPTVVDMDLGKRDQKPETRYKK
jgi:hypothetical protein